MLNFCSITQPSIFLMSLWLMFIQLVDCMLTNSTPFFHHLHLKPNNMWQMTSVTTSELSMLVVMVFWRLTPKVDTEQTSSNSSNRMANFSPKKDAVLIDTAPSETNHLVGSKKFLKWFAIHTSPPAGGVASFLFFFWLFIRICIELECTCRTWDLFTCLSVFDML